MPESVARSERCEKMATQSISLDTNGTHPSFDMKVDFFDALSSNDIDRAASVFAEEGSLLFPGLRPMKGRLLVKRMLGVIRRRYDDIVWQPTSPVIASGGWMVTSWDVAGTFKNSAQLYSNDVVSLAQLDRSGKILVLSDYFKDTLAFHPGRQIPASADPRYDASNTLT